MHVKNWLQTIGTEKKSDILSQLGKGEQFLDICCNVRFTHIACIQFVIMLIKLQVLLRQEQKVFA